MRIEAYNQVAAVYKTNKAVGTRKTSGAAVSRDEVQISSFGRDYQIAKNAVAEAPDIREDKVTEVAAKVNSGSYRVDAGDFADRLIARYHSLMM